MYEFLYEFLLWISTMLRLYQMLVSIRRAKIHPIFRKWISPLGDHSGSFSSGSINVVPKCVFRVHRRRPLVRLQSASTSSTSVSSECIDCNVNLMPNEFSRGILIPRVRLQESRELLPRACLQGTSSWMAANHPPLVRTIPDSGTKRRGFRLGTDFDRNKKTNIRKNLYPNYLLDYTTQNEIIIIK